MKDGKDDNKEAMMKVYEVFYQKLIYRNMKRN